MRYYFWLGPVPFGFPELFIVALVAFVATLTIVGLWHRPPQEEQEDE